MEIIEQNSLTISDALKTCNYELLKQALINDIKNINLQDERLGWVPIYKAILYGDYKICELLLQNGANPNI